MIFIMIRWTISAVFTLIALVGAAVQYFNAGALVAIFWFFGFVMLSELFKPTREELNALREWMRSGHEG